MRLLEKFLAIALVISLSLKFSLISGGNYLTMLILSALSIVYFPLGFFLFNQIGFRQIFRQASYYGLSTLKILLPVITGLGLSIISIGSLFKFLDLPGGHQMLIAGLPILLIVLVISLRNSRDESEIYKLIFKRIGIIGSCGVIMLFISPLTIIKYQYRNHPDYINAYVNYLNDTRNEELRKKKEIEYYRIILSEEEFKRHQRSID
jgi:hypothetical protein